MKRRFRKQRGFTLVELLVVISIIGMLVAMLLPAVQSARESGRQSVCRNNMRNMGLAIIQYETARSQYPGYVIDLGTGAADNANGQRSWVYAVLPYMDKRALYDQLTGVGTPNTVITNSLEVSTCPSNPPEATNSAALHFVVNTGQVDRDSATATIPHDGQGNGVFHRNAPDGTSPAGFRQIVNSAAYVAGGDGMGTTLMVSENSDAARWTGLRDSSSPQPTERWLGFCYDLSAVTAPGTANALNGGTPGPSVMPSNDPNSAQTQRPMGLNVQFGQTKAVAVQSRDMGWARPSAFHPNGLNVMFCDNHVRFISDTISYGIFQALCTPKGSSMTEATSGTLYNPLAHQGQRVDFDERSIQ